MGLQISIRKCDDVTILDLRGRSTIDGGESELLSSHLQELVTNGVRKVLLNLANLTQVDSSAVGVIIETYVSLKRQVGDSSCFLESFPELRSRGDVIRHNLDSYDAVEPGIAGFVEWEARRFSAGDGQAASA